MNDRKGYIGGSDIAAVMGLSRWKTPLMLWAEKTGEVQPEDLSDKEYVELGTELEDFVAKKFERKAELKVRRAPKTYIHKEYDFMRCHVDRLITLTDYVLSCKTCSAWKEKEWEGEEIPTEYILQLNWELGLTERSVGYIAVLIGGQKFRYKKIDFDNELFDSQIKAAVSFWQMVKDKTPPIAEAADNSFMVELYPTAGEAIKEASQDVTDAVAALQLIKAEIIEAEKKKDEIEVKLKEIIGVNAGIKTPEYTVKWLNVKGSTFTVTKKDSRMLRITKNKGA